MTRWRLIVALLLDVESETRRLITLLGQLPVTRRKYRGGQPAGGGPKVRRARETDTKRPPTRGKFPPKP